MRITAAYTWTDYKTNTQITKELKKKTPILYKLLEYKSSWIQHVNRMPRNRLPRVMKHYSPTDRRNHGRHFGYVRPERVNKWPNCMTDIWWWWWWYHRRICGPSLTETSLCGAWLYCVWDKWRSQQRETRRKRRDKTNRKGNKFPWTESLHDCQKEQACNHAVRRSGVKDVTCGTGKTKLVYSKGVQGVGQLSYCAVGWEQAAESSALGFGLRDPCGSRDGRHFTYLLSYLLTYLHTYLLTYSIHTAESFFRS
jgi:hypothetical protein